MCSTLVTQLIRNLFLLATLCHGSGGQLFAQLSPTVASAQLEVQRHVLCLFGIDKSDPARTPIWAADTYTNQMLQLSMEWNGYVVDYWDVSQGRPPEHLASRYSGVILDSQLELPFEDEEFYVKWVLSQRDRGLKLLIVGGVPGDRVDLRQKLIEGLGMRGSAEEILGAKNPKFSALDKEVVDVNLVPQPRTSGLVVLQAPEEARVALSVSCTDIRGLEVRSDAVFTTSWGGAVLEPYLFFRTSGEDVRTVTDQFKLVARVFPPAEWPIPDATTRDGLRMFLSYIDGDGFTTLTRTQKNVTCAEVIRDQFLKHYPLPVGVSVIEADTCAKLKDQLPADKQRYEDIARSMFLLPNVQGGSHSFSHPFVWMDEDKESKRGYHTLNLDLADPTSYPKIILEREIKGSVDYIQRELMPPGKKMELFLWSGNCRPSGAAVSMVRGMGLEALNGGNTMISRRAQGIASISAVDVLMDGVQQVFAPVQNEYVYTNGFLGPLYGGFRLVIDTFNLTESPRRLKPVCLYYHFYCAQTGDSLKSLKEVHDWALGQPLHSVTGAQFAKMARDTRYGEMYRLGPKRWSFKSEGHCRTFRVPASWGEPYLPGCSGIVGFNTHQDQIYIHTNGADSVILDYSKKESPDRIYLVTSSGECQVQEATPDKFSADVKDLRPVQLRLGGFSKAGTFAVLGSVDGVSMEPKPLKVDKGGTVTLTLPPSCSFTLQRQT
jgi:polysaccharide biosynthesis protein PelA